MEFFVGVAIGVVLGAVLESMRMLAVLESHDLTLEEGHVKARLRCCRVDENGIEGERGRRRLRGH
jgi:hypothetical protein